MIDVSASGHYTGDCRDLLKQLPDACVQTCITSPPYFGLRDYGTAHWEGGDPACDHRESKPERTAASVASSTLNGSTDTVHASHVFRGNCGRCGAVRVDRQIGLEPTPEAYVESLVGVFREVRRVLRDDGTLWLNLGDSYAGGKQGRDDEGPDDIARRASTYGTGAPKALAKGADGKQRAVPAGLKPKDLVGVPWMVAFALRADGWVLRSEIIWSKSNPMPESVTDRPTKAHEQIFLFSKAKWSGPEPGRFAHVSDADARWLALLIDTEGSIVVKRNRHDGRGDTFAPQVSIGNTSEALMREVQRITGHGSLLERPGRNCRLLYWQVANGIAADFLRRLYPFLIVKQRQARIGIRVDSLTYYRGGQRSERKQRSDAELRQLESLWSRNKRCNHFESPDLSDVPEPEFGRWVTERYYYDADAIAERATSASRPRNMAEMKSALSTPGAPHQGSGENDGARNKRSVWTVATQPYDGAHFACFPPKLIEPCVLAGSRPGDLVLDPFFGSGTTGAVAEKHGRRWIGFDLAYADLAAERTAQRSLVLG